MHPDIVVPALAFRTSSGNLDEKATARYARRAASTWVDRFLLSGTTTRGEAFSESERGAVLDLWRDVSPPTRLLACCWSTTDVENAQGRAIAPMVVMRDLPDHAAAVDFLRSLPADAYAYSHPAHSTAVFDAQLCATAREGGCLPVGAKVSKVTYHDIRSMRAEVGSEFKLWDASSRNIRGSVAAGASGVVATPLSPFMAPFPAYGVVSVQAVIDRVQADLDRIQRREARSALLTGLAAGAGDQRAEW